MSRFGGFKVWGEGNHSGAAKIDRSDMSPVSGETGQELTLIVLVFAKAGVPQVLSATKETLGNNLLVTANNVVKHDRAAKPKPNPPPQVMLRDQDGLHIGSRAGITSDIGWPWQISQEWHTPMLQIFKLSGLAVMDLWA